MLGYYAQHFYNRYIHTVLHDYAFIKYNFYILLYIECDYSTTNNKFSMIIKYICYIYSVIAAVDTFVKDRKSCRLSFMKCFYDYYMIMLIRSIVVAV